MQGVMGAKGVIEPSFVYLPGVAGGSAVQKSVEGLEYFSTNLELGVVSHVKLANDRSTVRNKHIHLERSLRTNRVY